MSNEHLLNRPGSRVIELDIEGMTCASCVNRVERKLGKLDGVQASVNLPLESAQVTVPAGITDEQITATVEAAGYKARVRPPLYSDPASRQFADQGSGHETDAPGTGDAGTRRPVTTWPTVAPPPKLRPRLIAAAILTVPVFVISMFPAFQFSDWGWVAAVLALPVVTWTAWPFHRAAAVNARHFASTMDTLVSIGVVAAYLFSAWQLLAEPRMTEHPGMEMGSGGLYFEVASVVTTFLLLGRYLEANAKQKAGDALKALLNLGAKDATVLADGAEFRIPADQLAVGDVIVVRPGEKIATDGVVIEGNSAVDASLVTGESVPVEVGPDSPVTGATINTSGRLLVRATRVGSETTLAQMARLVSQAQTGKAPIARLADRISAVFVPVVLVLAVITFAIWLLVAGPAVTDAELRAAFTAAVAVLVIACPCALGLATPVGLLTGTGRGAQLGILIKGPQVLEDTRTVDTILLDKTGTVTTRHARRGRHPGLRHLQQRRGAASCRRGGGRFRAPHRPCHRRRGAVRREGRNDDGGRLPAVEHFRSAPGGGVAGSVGGPPGHGRPDGLAAGKRHTGQRRSSRRRCRPAEESGATAIWVAVDGEAAGIVSLRDTIKPGSAAAISRLKATGPAADPADRRQRRGGRAGGRRRRHRARGCLCRRAAGGQGRRRPQAAGRRAPRWPWPATV